MKINIKLHNANDKKLQAAIKFCFDYLDKFDTAEIKRITIDTTKRNKTINSSTHWPYRPIKKSFSLTCRIDNNIILPYDVLFRRSPLYFIKNGVPVEGANELHEKMKLNPNYILGSHNVSMKNFITTTWVQLMEKMSCYSFDELIAAHFGFHIGYFLSQTKQLKFKSTAVELSKFQGMFLKEYISYKSNKKFVIFEKAIK